jgi:hypothetical protein
MRFVHYNPATFAALFVRTKAVSILEGYFQIRRHASVLYTHDFCENVPVIQKIKVCGAHRRRSTFENTSSARNIANFRNFVHNYHFFVQDHYSIFYLSILQAQITEIHNKRNNSKNPPEDRKHTGFFHPCDSFAPNILCVDILPICTLLDEKTAIPKKRSTYGTTDNNPKSPQLRRCVTCKRHRMLPKTARGCRLFLKKSCTPYLSFVYFSRCLNFGAHRCHS